MTIAPLLRRVPVRRQAQAWSLKVGDANWTVSGLELAKPQILSWPEAVERRGKCGVDAALDYIFLECDRALREGLHSAVEDFLDSIPGGTGELDLLIGALTVTLPVRHLPARIRLLEDARRALLNRPDVDERLLYGL